MHARHKVITAVVLLMLVLILTTLAGCSSAPAGSRDFTISQDNITIALQADGSALISETVSYNMLRSLKTFVFAINYAESGSINLEKIEIAASSTDEFVAIQPNTAENQDNTAAYEADDDGATLNIRVTAVSEKDSRRTIRLTYQLAQVVWQNDDNAVLKGRFFTLHEFTPTARASLTLLLPEQIPAVQMWYLPVSRTAYTAARPQADALIFSGAATDGNQAMTLYCLFPTLVFNTAKHQTQNQTWDALTSEARQAADALLREDQLRTDLYYFIFIMLAFAVLFGLIIYFFFDREVTALFRMRYWQRLPAGCPPAVLAILQNKAWPGRLILATLLDLVRRRVLTLRGNVFALPETGSRHSAGLLAFEEYLVQWLFEHVTQDSMISTAEIRRFACDPATAAEMQAFYIQFSYLIEQEIDTRHLIDQRRIRIGRWSAVLASLGYLAMTIISFVVLLHIASLLLLVPCLAMAIYAWKIRRLTPAGREIFAVTKALKRTIIDGDGQKMAVEPTFFAEMLPLAAALAVDERLISNLLSAGEKSAQPYEEFALENYGIIASANPWAEQIAALGADLKVMESMLSASLLLSAGLHH